MSQYFRLRDTDVHRTWTVDRGTLVDIDVDGHPVGIEILADEVQMVDFVEVLLAIADRAVIPDGPLDEIDESIGESEDREAGLGQKSENRGWSGHRLTVSDEVVEAVWAALNKDDDGRLITESMVPSTTYPGTIREILELAVDYDREHHS